MDEVPSLADTSHIPGQTIDTIQEEQLLPCIESGQEVTPHQTIRLIRECVERGRNDVYIQSGQTNTITYNITEPKGDTELRKLKDKKICVYDNNDVEKSYLSKKRWKISKQDIHEIVTIETSLGFPQCCRAFLSDQACFDKSVEFFKRPLKVIGDILYEMSRSSDKDVQHDYCVLGCVLIYGGFSEEYIRKIDDSKSDICFKVSDIAKACGLDSVLSRNVSLSFERLSTSYLAFRNGKYLFRHDSMLESVFSSFFKLRIELLIDYCEWKLLERLISTDNKDEKEGFCILHQDHYSMFIDRLLEELTENSRGYSGTVKSLLSHRVFNNTKFVKSFFQNLSVSQKSTILAIRHGYILEQLGDCPSVEFVVRLVSELQSQWCADDIERGLRRALYRACVVDNYNVYEYLTTKHSLIPDATCLFESCSRCSIKVLSDMLERYEHWSPKYHICEALNKTCLSGFFNIYKDLMAYIDEHEIACIAGIDLLQYAVEGARCEIVSDLLQRYKKLFLASHLQVALIAACRSKFLSAVDVYKCLMAYVDEQEIEGITGVDLLQYVAEGGHSGIVSDLLRRYKDSFKASHIQEALIGACRSEYVSSVDFYKCLMAYVDEHQIKGITGVDLLQYAAEGGSGGGKVSDLLRRYKNSFKASHIQEALIGACQSIKVTSVDVYTCLMAYVDEHQIKGIKGVDLLQYAAEGGGSGIVSDLLRRYKDSFLVSHLQEALISACRSEFESSVAVYKCLMAYVDEHQIKGIKGVDLLQYAAEGGGGSGKVSDLLRRYKDSFLVSHIQEALIGACRSEYESSVDIYKCLMAYVDEHQIKDITGVDLLQYAAEGGGGSGKVSDLLRRYKDSFLVSHIQEALIGACRSGYESSVAVYKCLMAYVDEHQIKDIAGVDLLQYAAEGGCESGIVSDLLRRYKDSFLVSHIQEALIGACRSEYESSVDIYKCLMAYVDEHQIKGITGVNLLQYAAEGGSGGGKVSDLLRRYKDSFLVSHIQEALIGACRSGYESSVAVYKCLMAYVDEHQIKDIAGVDLLQYAAEGGGSGKVSDLLRRYKDSFLVSHLQEALISACRSEFESSVAVYKCLMAYVDEHQIKGIKGVDLLQYAAEGGSGGGKVSDLLRRYKDSFLVSHIQEALIGACRSGYKSSVDVYKCLMAYVDEHQIKDIAGVDLLQYAAEGGGSGKVSDLLRRYKNSFKASHIQEALIGACRSRYDSSVDIYKCLMAYVDEHQIKGITGVDLLQYAAEGGGSGIVSDLLRRYKNSFKASHIQEALIGACRSRYESSVDIYKCLMAYVDEHQIKDIAGVDLLQYAAEECGGSGIVSDLLRRYKDSFKASHIQGALIGACRSGYESSVDVYKCLMAYVDEHQIKDIAGVDLLQHAAESGGSGIVSDLLRRYKDSFLVSHIQEALIGACRSGYESSVDVYKCLMAYVDENQIKDITGVDLLQCAVQGGGGSGIVFDLLRRYKDSFLVSHIQEALIGACQSGYESSVDVYKCLMAYVNEHQIKDIAGVDLLQYAAEGGGGSGKVSDLLQRYKDLFKASHIQDALIGACRSRHESSVDIYKCLMAYVDDHQIEGIKGVDLLQYAIEGGGRGIVSDLLRRYKDSFLVSHIQEALIGACRSRYKFSVDIYKCLMAYVGTARRNLRQFDHQIKGITGVDLLQYAIEGGESGKVSDLLRRFKDSFLVSHIQEALIGACRLELETLVDVYKCLMAYVAEHPIKDIAGVNLSQYAAEEGGGSGKVSDLLQLYKHLFLASQIQMALISACRSISKSSLNVYKCLIAYADEHRIKDIEGVDLLQYAVEGSSSDIMSDLLQRYKNSFNASQSQMALIGARVFWSSVDVYKFLMAYVHEHDIKGNTGVDFLQYAIEGAHSAKVSDLLQRCKDSSQYDSSQIQIRLINTCQSRCKSSVDVYKCLMAYINEHQINDIAGVELVDAAKDINL
ncbi:hypothetical protein ScPMuIL_015974 [Solemya velum]